MPAYVTLFIDKVLVPATCRSGDRGPVTYRAMPDKLLGSTITGVRYTYEDKDGNTVVIDEEIHPKQIGYPNDEITIFPRTASKPKPDKFAMLAEMTRMMNEIAKNVEEAARILDEEKEVNRLSEENKRLVALLQNAYFKLKQLGGHVTGDIYGEIETFLKERNFLT